MIDRLFTNRVNPRAERSGEPLVMAVLNITPDSFYSGSREMQLSKIIDIVGQMLADGADIIDVGGMSSRPGSAAPSISEEIDRITGPLMALRAAYPEALLSIDTYRSPVLKICIDAKIDIVNDISAGRMDDEFLDLVATQDLPYVLMHMQGAPRSMQADPHYDNVVLDVMKFFDQKIEVLREKGVHKIILDPGFGFGKTIAHNYELLNRLESFQIFDLPILVGLSRKSMIYKPLGIGPDVALNGTTALNMMALERGAEVIRVHDVREAKECIRLWQLLHQNQIR